MPRMKACVAGLPEIKKASVNRSLKITFSSYACFFSGAFYAYALQFLRAFFFYRLA